MNEEREINLLDLMADILSHWRGLLVSMVIGAILMGGFSYVKSYRGIAAAEASSEESGEEEGEEPEDGEELEDEVPTLEDLEELMPDTEKLAVHSLLDDEQENLIVQKYAESSVLMKADPYHIPRTELIFRIQMDDMGQSYMARSVYEDLVNGVGMLEWVEEKTKIPAAAADELISAQAKSNIVVLNGGQSTEAGSDCLKVVVTHQNAAKCRKLVQCVKDYIGQQQEQLLQELGAHEVVLLSESTSEIMDMGLRDRQISYNNNRLSFMMNIAKAKEAFTENQAIYYDLLTGGDGILDEPEDEEDSENPDDEASDESAEDGSEAAVAVPSVSVKYVVLGAFLFVFAYAGIFFVIYLFNGKIRPVDDLQSIYNISQLGLITKDGEKKEFVIDRWIEALRNRNRRQFTKDQSLDLAVAAVKISAEKHDLDSICFLGCDLKAGADAVCRELKERLKPENIRIHILDNVLYDAGSMAELGNVKSVVFVEKAMSTMYDELARELELVSRQGIKVLGGIIVE